LFTIFLNFVYGGFEKLLNEIFDHLVGADKTINSIETILATPTKMLFFWRKK